MHWEVLIIPLIAFGVWLLGNLFKSPDEDEKKKGTRGEGRGQGDLDRFLAQARRRREQETARQPEPDRPPEVVPARNRPAREAPRRPPETRPQRAREQTQPTAQPVRRASERPALQRPAVVLEVVEEARPLPVAAPVAMPGARQAIAVPQVPDAPQATPTNPTNMPGAMTASRQAPSALLVQVARQLRSPQAAATAFVLREIFDRPLSQRPRR